MTSRALLSLLFAPALLIGQEVGTPGGVTYAKYSVSQSWELGYRFAEIGGAEGKYRSDVNYRNGIRLLNSSLSVHSLEGRGHVFDELVLTTAGLGNDPYQSATFRVQKNRLYRYDMIWRSNDYFNPGLTVASGLHLTDTTHRWQDHDLILFPQSALRIRAGYGRTTQDGPALTTEQLFDSRGDVFPIFRNLRQQYNEYRLGFDAKFSGVRLTVQRRWEYFKEDSPRTVTSAETGTAPAVLAGYTAPQPYRGRTPSWMGNLNGEFKWIAVNARATYAGGKGDFVQNEIATGTDRFGSAQSRQIVVRGSGDRPVMTGDFNVTVFPGSRLTIVTNFSASSTRMVGNNAFTQFDLGSLTSARVNFQYLAVRLVTNATDIRYRFSKKFDAFGGFRYADRFISSNETGAVVGSPLPPFVNERSDRTKAGILGFNLLPVTGWRVHLEGELGRNDNPFAPITLAKYHAIRARTQYRYKTASLGGSYQELYNNNSIVITAFSSKSRNYSANASWAAKSGMSLDASYSKLHLDTIGGIAFFAGSPRPTQVNSQSIYISNIHAFNTGIHLTPTKAADIYVGYSLTKDTGDGRATLATQPTAAGQVFYNVQTFPLTYQTPVVRLSIRINQKVRWNAAWQYYGYHEQFGVLSFNQNYRANTGYTSLLWSF